MRQGHVEPARALTTTQVGVKWDGSANGDAEITIRYFIQLHGVKTLKSDDKFSVFDDYSDVDTAIVHENQCYVICDRVVDEVVYPNYGASFDIIEVYQGQTRSFTNLNPGDPPVTLGCGLTAHVDDYP
jgi:hypothetical protein